MLLDVDVDSLINNRTTVDIYFLLQLVKDKEYIKFSKYLALYTSEEKKNIFDKFNKSGYCNNYNNFDEFDPTKIEITSEFSNFLLSGDYFDELLQIYPMSITRPDGTKDYLRTDTKRSRTNYNRIIGKKKHIHDHIIECLRYEIAIRTKNGTMGFFKRLPKWITSEEWLVYEQALKDSSFESLTNTDIGYGNKLE